MPNSPSRPPAPAPQQRGRRGIPTWALSIGTLLGLAVVVVVVLIGSLRPPAGEMAVSGASSQPPESMPSTAVAGTGGPAITGAVTVAPELAGRASRTHVLFIIARKGAGPPFAVKRIVDPAFPLAYRIGPEDVMMTGAPFEGEVSVGARLSAAGNAGPAQPGDLEGEHPGRVAVGAHGVDIVITQAR